MLSAAWAGGIRGARPPRAPGGTPPVDEDAVSTLQEFLNSRPDVPHSGVFLSVDTIADVPVDGVVFGYRRRAFDTRISPTYAQQLKSVETAAGEVDRSENQRAGRARPNRHHTTIAFARLAPDSSNISKVRIRYLPPRRRIEFQGQPRAPHLRCLPEPLTSVVGKISVRMGVSSVGANPISYQHV